MIDSTIIRAHHQAAGAKEGLKNKGSLYPLISLAPNKSGVVLRPRYFQRDLDKFSLRHRISDAVHETMMFLWKQNCPWQTSSSIGDEYF